MYVCKKMINSSNFLTSIRLFVVCHILEFQTLGVCAALIRSQKGIGAGFGIRKRGNNPENFSINAKVIS